METSVGLVCFRTFLVTSLICYFRSLYDTLSKFYCEWLGWLQNLFLSFVILPCQHFDFCETIFYPFFPFLSLASLCTFSLLIFVLVLCTLEIFFLYWHSLFNWFAWKYILIHLLFKGIILSFSQNSVVPVATFFVLPDMFENAEKN